MRLSIPKKLIIASLPTPIHQLERIFPKRNDRPNIWIKRDDDTGGVISGNKVRKLEFVVQEAMRLGADTLITCGGIQSNHCRATAAVARRVGMDVVLFLRGEKPQRAEGNYFLDSVLGSEIHFITPEQYDSRDELMETHASLLEKNGKRPHIIAEGASMPMGCWGYIGASAEIKEAEQELGVKFDALVYATGSGGTAAGLELGARMFGLEAKPWAVNVCDDEAYFREKIHSLIEQTSDRFELAVSIEKEEIGIIDGYVGRGYALSRPEELDLILDVARKEGVILDPAYTGKAFFGLVNEIERGRFDSAKNILFIHTGGVFGLFPKVDEIPLD